MKHLLRSLVLCAMVVFGTEATAQTGTIKGVLQDSAGSPLKSATVRLKSVTDTSKLLTTTTDTTGAFNFIAIPTAQYNLSASFVGYDDFTRILNLTADTTIDLGPVPMFRKISGSLGDVVVVGRTPPAQQKGDTIQFNASAFKVNPDASLEDMLKKAPGITVENGTVTAQGEQVKRVTIDGRQFFGDDATAALKNLPAEVIDKIQVFDRLSDQSQLTGFDDGNGFKAINIVTKANMRQGQFGRLYAGYGTDDRYAAGGNVNIFNKDTRINLIGLFNNINQQNFSSEDLLGVSGQANQGGGGRGGGGGGPRGGGGGGFGGFGGGGNNFFVGQQAGITKTNAVGINFSDLWGKTNNLELTGSYFFNNSGNINNSTANREQFLGDTSLFIKESGNSNTNNYNHRFNVRMEYKIDSSNTLIIAPNLSFQNNKSFSETFSNTITENGFFVNDQINRRRANTEGYNFRNELTYRHGFKKRGRSISVSINTGLNDRNGDIYTDAISKSANKAGIISTDSTILFTDQFSSGFNVSGNISYTEPLTQKSQLQLNYNPSFSKSKSDQGVYEYENASKDYTLFDESLSNKFDNRVTSHNAGVTYRLGDRDNQFQAGVNYQNTNLNSEQIFPLKTTVDKSYNNWLPNISWRKKLSAKTQLRLNYRTSVNPPSINQLQNVINKTNPLRITTGNEFLDQSYTHTLFARLNFTNPVKGTSMFMNIFGQKTNNYVANATYTASADTVLKSGDTLRRGGQFIQPVNLDGYWSGRVFFTYGVPLKFIKSNLNFNAGFSYTKAPGLVNYVKNISDNFGYNAGVVVSSNISEFIDFTLSYSGTYNVVKNSIQTTSDNHYYSGNAAARINLLSKSGWFLLNDITNQMYSGLSASFNQSYWLWNISAGKKFLKNQRGELKLTVFDLLKQNQSIVRTVTDSYIEDSQSDVLQQYFMLTFTYNLKNFGKASTRQQQRRQGGGDFRGGGGF